MLKSRLHPSQRHGKGRGQLPGRQHGCLLKRKRAACLLAFGSLRSVDLDVTRHGRPEWVLPVHRLELVGGRRRLLTMLDGSHLGFHRVGLARHLGEVDRLDARGWTLVHQ
eukprot:4497696-Prorocentrum_lima.AAC.1